MKLYIIPISGEDKYIIYRPLNGLAFVGNKALVDLALSLADPNANPEIRPDIQEFLQACGFFEPDPPIFDLTSADHIPFIAVPLLTNQCQLRCSYCYAAAGAPQKQVMPFENGKAIIDYVAKSAQDAGQPFFEVAFHGGGEPTHSWGLLKALSSHARGKELPAKISLTSNGIWSTEQCEWILVNVDELSLSMDGSPDTQDTQRPLSSGKPSSSWVMDTIRRLDQSKLNYGIRMTAMDPWHHLPKDVAFICEETKCMSIQVEPAFNTSRGGHPLPDPEEARGFSEGFIEAVKIARGTGRHLQYSGARLEITSTVFCRAPFNTLIVNLDGNLVSCYEVTDQDHPLADISSYGFINDGKVRIYPPNQARLHQLLAERRKGCKSCFLYWSCAGDCYARVFQPDDGGHLIYGARCDMNRQIFKECLLMEIAGSEGVWRRTNMDPTHRVAAYNHPDRPIAYG